MGEKMQQKWIVFSGHLRRLEPVQIWEHRYLLLNPNMDSPNSQIILSPVETTSQSPQCVFGALCAKFAQFERYLLGIVLLGFLGIYLYKTNGSRSKKAQSLVLNPAWWLFCQSWISFLNKNWTQNHDDGADNAGKPGQVQNVESGRETEDGL